MLTVESHTRKEAREAGYSCNCKEAREAGYSPYECHQAGYTYQEGQAAGYRYGQQLITCGFPRPW